MLQTEKDGEEERILQDVFRLQEEKSAKKMQRMLFDLVLLQRMSGELFQNCVRMIINHLFGAGI